MTQRAVNLIFFKIGAQTAMVKLRRHEFHHRMRPIDLLIYSGIHQRIVPVGRTAENLKFTAVGQRIFKFVESDGDELNDTFRHAHVEQIVAQRKVEQLALPEALFADFYVADVGHDFSGRECGRG